MNQPLNLDQIEAIADRAAADPFHASDCEGSLQVWRESALTHVRRDDTGQITSYCTPPSYRPTDQIIDIDLDSWDPGEDEMDDVRRQDITDLVNAREAMPAMAAEIRRLRADAAAELLPTWEAVYEPGNVSDYLIGYTNDEAPAKAAAEAWLRSQADVTGRLEWVHDDQLAVGEYDRWFELVEHHDDGIPTGPGLIVRRRTAVEAHVVADDSNNTDTLPAWLARRFDPQGAPWDGMSDDDRAYWQHQARAVRRAVTRGGFKTDPAAVSAAARP